MRKSQITLTSLLLLSGALPIWIYLAVQFFGSRPFWGLKGFSDPLVAAPIVLCGLTLAIHQLLRNRQNAWLISVCLAGMVTMAVLSSAVWLARN